MKTCLATVILIATMIFFAPLVLAALISYLKFVDKFWTMVFN